MSNKKTVAEMQSDYNWVSALDVAGAPYGVEGYQGSLVFNGWQDITEVVAASEGENDGASWIAIFRLNDERYLFLSASCDYTGWDCQAGGFAQLASSLDDIVRWALSNEDRQRLGFKLKFSVMADARPTDETPHGEGGPGSFSYFSFSD